MKQALRTSGCSCPFLNPDLSGIHRALRTRLIPPLACGGIEGGGFEHSTA